MVTACMNQFDSYIIPDGKYVHKINLSTNITRAISVVSVRNLFAYSSTDRLIYLRQFATKGSDMKLVATMKGHVSEVTQFS